MLSIITSIVISIGIQPLTPLAVDNAANPCTHPPNDFGFEQWLDKYQNLCGVSCGPIKVYHPELTPPRYCYHYRTVSCICIDAHMQNYMACLTQVQGEYWERACTTCWPLLDPNGDGDTSDGNLGAFQQCMGWAWLRSQEDAQICFDAQDWESCCYQNGTINCP